MLIDEEDYLVHYGILRRSGRYPWGSGGDEESNNRGFLGYVDGLRKQGMSEAEIAKGLGTSTTQLRAARSIAKNQLKQADIAMAQRLADKGYSNVAIGQRMGKSESSVRALLAPGEKDKADVLKTTANMLKEQVDQKKYVDIGVGAENHIGISQTKLATAVAMLREEGYEVHKLKVEQLGTGMQTELKVLANPGTTQKEVWQNRDQIKQVANFSEDGGRSYLGIHEPLSIDSKRIDVRYAHQGGAEADGVIYVRPGVKDISLGANRYAQVRIAVNGTHYLKGMAMYKDDLPHGVDLMFNTNKEDTGNKLDAMKKMKDDPDNPFGAVIRQIVEKDEHGKERPTSAMNIVNDEGDWERWSKNLSSQFLSKQSPSLAKTQLDLGYDRRKNELDEILALTNPAVRKKLLESFADSSDAASVHLKAAALPRQKTHVILPVNAMKETEVYAPNFRNGERVVLVRHPHAGTFEIPELTVNNRNPTAKALLGNAANAIGIHSKVAQRLSGADFDGDTVLVIPNNKGLVKTSRPLEKLKDFDPVHAYPGYEGMPTMTAHQKGHQMGLVSNLITDMTIKGASSDELAAAVRHSMVVIDAEKHNLNYKQSALDNNISSLMQKYQGSKTGGASTIISRAKSETRVPERNPRPAAKGGPIDRETGKKVYDYTGATRTVTKVSKRTGEVKTEEVLKTDRSTKLAETENAHILSSGTVIEKIYADHSNKLKTLANQARKELVHTGNVQYSPSAAKTYASEVASLSSKLNIALRNAPLERQAQILANAIVSQKRRANPEMDNAELKKIKAQALAEARTRTGAGKKRIDISDNEWNAIQAGAISNNKLDQILNNADLDKVKALATPKSRLLMTDSKKAAARAMLDAGYTQAEVADHLGVSLTTLKTSLHG
jgi:transposase